MSNLRGRLSAFQKNVLGSTIDSLNVALENVSSSQSTIQDTDFASETANLTRNQILVQAATSVLSQANQAAKRSEAAWLVDLKQGQGPGGRFDGPLVRAFLEAGPWSPPSLCKSGRQTRRPSNALRR